MTERERKHTKVTKESAIRDGWRVDYEEWAARDTWTVYEAIALLVSEIVPPGEDDEVRKTALANYKYHNGETDKLRRRIVAAMDMGKDAPLKFYARKGGEARVKPRPFVQWAMSKGFEVPEGLKKGLDIGAHKAKAANKPAAGKQTDAANKARRRKAHEKRERILKAAKKVATDKDTGPSVRNSKGEIVASQLAEKLSDLSYQLFDNDTPPLSLDRIVKKVLRPAIKDGTLR